MNSCVAYRTCRLIQFITSRFLSIPNREY